MARRTEEEGMGFGVFVIGAVVGALAALLLAPESGEESRRHIGQWLHLNLRHHNGHAVNGHGRHSRRSEA